MVVLSLGFAAIANLQVAALKRNQSAYLRSQAVALSGQMLDAMRADRPAALAGAYDRDFDDPVPTPAQAAASIAATNLRSWLRALENTMRPYDGQAGIERAGTRITVTLRWRDRLEEELLDARQRRWERFSVVTEL